MLTKRIGWCIVYITGQERDLKFYSEEMFNMKHLLDKVITGTKIVTGVCTETGRSYNLFVKEDGEQTILKGVGYKDWYKQELVEFSKGITIDKTNVEKLKKETSLQDLISIENIIKKDVSKDYHLDYLGDELIVEVDGGGNDLELNYVEGRNHYKAM